MTPAAQYKEYTRRGRNGRLGTVMSSQNTTRGIERVKYSFSQAQREVVTVSNISKRKERWSSNLEGSSGLVKNRGKRER